MGIVTWIVTGFAIAFMARRIMPDFAQGDLVITVLLGTAGAALGGFFVGLFGGNGATDVNLWSFLVAALGAIVLLFLYDLIARRGV
jgi:uncharacterized membrane protein YeaQ/YmgE (transglycosylase-associated protein family)